MMLSKIMHYIICTCVHSKRPHSALRTISFTSNKSKDYNFGALPQPRTYERTQNDIHYPAPPLIASYCLGRLRIAVSPDIRPAHGPPLVEY